MQYSFAQKTSLILRISTHLKLKIICSRNTAKNLSDFTTNISANMFLFGARKNIFTAQFFDTQKLHSWSTLKANFCIFLYISVYLIKKIFVPKTWNRGGGRRNNFLRFACYLHLVNVLFFHFNSNFLEIHLFFSISILPSIAMKS